MFVEVYIVPLKGSSHCQEPENCWIPSSNLIRNVQSIIRKVLWFVHLGFYVERYKRRQLFCIKFLSRTPLGR